MKKTRTKKTLASFCILSAMFVMLAPSLFAAPTSTTTSEDTLVRQALLHDLCRSGLLLQLPYGALYPSAKPLYMVVTNAILHSLDLDQSTPGNQQSVWVLNGTTITITGVFQVYDNYSPGAIRQAFFIYSWTPSWPPPSSAYYYALYDGVPGAYPGTGKQSFSFSLNVPSKAGVYYLYFCTEAHYSIPEAVKNFNVPLWVPYAVISVGQ